MKANTELKIRPYWHVDMKWTIALLLIPVFAFTLLLFNLYSMTTEANSVKISSTLFKTMYSPGDKESSQEIEEIRAAIRRSPDKKLKPFPGMETGVTEEDLDKYSVSEIKGRLFTELATGIYNFDASKMQYSPEGKKDALSNLGAMAIFTKVGHQFVGKILIYFSIATIILLALLIFFSYGFGRLISPGLIFFLVGAPASAILFALKNAPQKSLDPNTTEDVRSRISAVLGTIAPQISEIFLKKYIVLTIAGLVLILAGIIGRIIQRHKNKKLLNINKEVDGREN